MKNRFSLLWILVSVIALGAVAGTAIWFASPRKTPEEYYQMGLAAISASDWNQVAECADHLKDQPDFAFQEMLLRATYLTKTNQPAAALKILGQMDPTGELRAPALLAAGEALYQLNRLAEAQGLFAKLADEQPGHADAHRWLAAVAYDLGDLDRALDELGIVERLQPTDYRPHLLSAQMHYDLEQYAEATEEYQKAFAKNPPQAVIQQITPLLARSQIRTREYANAITTLKQHPPSAETLALEAECELSLGRAEVASALLTKARGFDEHQQDLLRVTAQIAMDAGNPSAAVQPLRAMLRRDPQDHESRHLLSQALRLSGKPEEADKEARLFTQTTELKRKLSELTQEAIAKPADPEIRERMAAICSQMGKNELAASWKKAAAACRQLQTGFTLPPGNPATP